MICIIAVSSAHSETTQSPPHATPATPGPSKVEEEEEIPEEAEATSPPVEGG